MSTSPSYPITDFHTHILPDMDDGSKDPETSLKLLEMLAKQGVTQVCLTPHFLPAQESISEFLVRREQAFSLLKASGPISQQLLLGAETAYAPGISSMPGLEKVCIQGTNVLLLEMPFCSWTQLEIEEVMALKLDRKLQVVLAHPERFLFSVGNEKLLQKLIDLSLPLQMNAEIFCHFSARKLGFQLLEATPYPLLGTDCHNLTNRKPLMEKARSVIARKLGRDFLDYIDESAELLLEK